MSEQLQAHPFADLFPMMTEAELDALAADIAEHGLRQPVVLYQKLVLDGRNRLLACERAGVEPTLTTYDGDDEGALALVESLNVTRRDLTPGQRAITAARRWKLRGDTKKRGRPSKGENIQPVCLSVEALAKKYKTSPTSVVQARDLIDEAPGLADDVFAGRRSLAPAWEELETIREERRQREEDMRRAAAYMEAVKAGEMTFEEAVEKAIQEERLRKQEEESQADARRTWLQFLIGMANWFDTFVASRTDQDLAWYADPDAPGAFDHGLTVDRLTMVITQLERIQTFTLGVIDGNGTNRSANKKGRAPARP